MPIHPRRLRRGRLLDWLVIALFSFVFVGLGVYHYRRLGEGSVDPERQRKLAEKKLSEKQSESHDWPHWRGPHRDGVSSEKGLLTSWPKEGPARLWEAKVGEGFASVVVSAGRVFCIFQDGDSEAVVCWDAETGKEIWRHRYLAAFNNKYGSGPRSTPSVDGDRIYTVGATGIMHCLDARTSQPQSRVVWRKDLLTEFAAPTNEWGVAFSPLVDGDRVFIMPGGLNGQSVAALDKKTGALLWQKHDDPASYSSPVSAVLHGRAQVLFLTGSRLLSVAPDSGDLIWSYPWKVQQHINVATPLVVDDYVFISTGYDKGCALLEIERHGEKQRPIKVFENRRMRNHFSSSVRVKEHLYGFDDTNLVCMDFSSGQVVWKQRDFDKGSLIAVDGHLIVYGANGLLALAEANPEEYVEKARFEFSKQGRQCWSVPVVANGRLYVRDQERLVCFDVKGRRE